MGRKADFQRKEHEKRKTSRRVVCGRLEINNLILKCEKCDMREYSQNVQDQCLVSSSGCRAQMFSLPGLSCFLPRLPLSSQSSGLRHWALGDRQEARETDAHKDVPTIFFYIFAILYWCLKQPFYRKQACFVFWVFFFLTSLITARENAEISNTCKWKLKATWGWKSPTETFYWLLQIYPNNNY